MDRHTEGPDATDALRYWDRAAAAYSARFAVDAFKEPVPSEAQLQQHPEWQHHRRVPSFIVARAVLLADDV